jgi:hypothetical protein
VGCPACRGRGAGAPNLGRAVVGDPGLGCAAMGGHAVGVPALGCCAVGVVETAAWEASPSSSCSITLLCLLVSTMAHRWERGIDGD